MMDHFVEGFYTLGKTDIKQKTKNYLSSRGGLVVERAT